MKRDLTINIRVSPPKGATHYSAFTYEDNGTSGITAVGIRYYRNVDDEWHYYAIIDYESCWRRDKTPNIPNIHKIGDI